MTENKEMKESLLLLEWRKEINELQKKFDEAEKRKRGNGVL